MVAFNDFLAWISSNLQNIVFSIVSITIIYTVYKLSIRQIEKLKEQKRLEANIAYILNRIFRWGGLLAVIVVVFTQFGIRIELFAGLLVLAGGTVLGFAAMNTLGNAIAGLILMTSRPFKIGDKIFFKGQFADVEAIDLIYTRIRTMDNVLISIPNQGLIQSEVSNFGKDSIIRRSCSIATGYELNTKEVEKALLEAADKVEEVLKEPQPHVWVTDFKDYAVEYTLFVFISEIRHIQKIDAKIRKTVLETCNRHNIEIATPTLIRSVN